MALSTFKKKNQQDEEKSLVCVAAYLDDINLGKEKQKKASQVVLRCTVNILEVPEEKLLNQFFYLPSLTYQIISLMPDNNFYYCKPCR